MDLRIGFIFCLIVFSFQAFGRIPYEEVEGYAISEDDVILGTIEEIELFNKKKGVGLFPYKRLLWTTKKIPYDFAHDINAKSRKHILSAIEHYHKYTSFKFVKRTIHKSYVKFVPWKKESCASYIGDRRKFLRPVQFIFVHPDCDKGVFIHELGHLLGLNHEHNRSDRDHYIDINWDLIPDKSRHNYEIKSYYKDYGEFDFKSVMLYGSFTGSLLQAVMTKKDGRYFYSHNVLSQGDINTLNEMYEGL